MCVPKTLVITNRGFVSYCEECRNVNICFEQILVQRTYEEFRTLYHIVLDFLMYNEPLSPNPNLRNLEFCRFANNVYWMVSINDLKDFQHLLRQAHQAFDTFEPNAYAPVPAHRFKSNMPELFRFEKLVN
jgi:glutaredoxin-related protein